ncbi:MAG: hypothetical protein P4M15_04810 [Alphaproteobacteria bacterium]|nr:hypothetical protein [Alphaproteobacteria bacterium]
MSVQAKHFISGAVVALASFGIYAPATRASVPVLQTASLGPEVSMRTLLSMPVAPAANDAVPLAQPQPVKAAPASDASADENSTAVVFPTKTGWRVCADDNTACTKADRLPNSVNLRICPDTTAANNQPVCDILATLAQGVKAHVIDASPSGSPDWYQIEVPTNADPLLGFVKKSAAQKYLKLDIK